MLGAALQSSRETVFSGMNCTSGNGNVRVGISSWLQTILSIDRALVLQEHWSELEDYVNRSSKG